MLKIIIIVAIIFAIAFVIGIIEGVKEDFTKKPHQAKASPPNYRITPWTNDWVGLDYRCGCCEHGHLRRYIDGEFKGYCAKYDMPVDCDAHVCDDYLEYDNFSAWRTSENKFVPLKGHFDHDPSQDK